ncbi:type I secretion system protein LssZ [Legionella sp. km772]|uniref:type I secretion system protein LssZ n=1 Tax=Legionella sp. km772 TaxID=2498111 RepID=UPI000F8F2B6A|nr:type I secretion system protein LssZ [Legionella sp. km772]RUR11983.1 type I secretion system protein LssZ [Legionella sp. km772]
MLLLAHIIHYLLPLAALLSLIWGLSQKALYYIISALWLSLIALILHYQHSGGVIFGSYFDYNNAFLYSLNLIILATSLIYIIEHLRTVYIQIKNITLVAQILIALTSLLMIFNLCINAYFFNDRLAGSPIIQVALMEKPSYCDFKYIFYKITKQGSTDYLCPNYYGLIPKIGHLSVSPDFIARQLALPTKKQMLLLQKKKD